MEGAWPNADTCGQRRRVKDLADVRKHAKIISDFFQIEHLRKQMERRRIKVSKVAERCVLPANLLLV